MSSEIDSWHSSSWLSLKSEGDLVLHNGTLEDEEAVRALLSSRRRSVESRIRLLHVAELVGTRELELRGTWRFDAVRRFVSALHDQGQRASDGLPYVRALRILSEDDDTSELAVSLRVVEVVTAKLCGLQGSRRSSTDQALEAEKSGAYEKATQDVFWAEAAPFLASLVESRDKARLHLLDCTGMEVFAFGVLHDETQHIRHVCASAMATVGKWSGPRHAVTIVETPHVLSAYEYVLRDPGLEFSLELRMQTIDAVCVLGSRNRARGVLMSHKIETALQQAAKDASISSNYTLAAKASVAAGSLSGKTLNDMGFLVDTEQPNEARSDSSVSTEDRGELGSRPAASPLPKLRPRTSVDSKNRTKMLQMQKQPQKTRLVELSDYLSLALASANANRGLQVEDDDNSFSRWSKFVEVEDDKQFQFPTKGEEKEALRRLTLEGVPHLLRCKVWPAFLAVDEQRSKEGMYEKALAMPLPDQVKQTIDKDVTRTLPSHELFWSGGAQVGLRSLRNILWAYAAMVPEVGYCQGMSTICALLLVNASVEEEAFLMLLSFMNRFRYIDVFKPGLAYLYEMIDYVKYSAEVYTPRLLNKLDEDGVPLDSFLPVWFMTGFAYCLPPNLTFRLWDILLFEGTTDMFIRAALAVLSLSEDRVLEWTMEENIMWFQNGFSKQGNRVTDDVDKFIRVARSFDVLRRRRKATSNAAKSKSGDFRVRSSRVLKESQRVADRIRKPVTNCLCGGSV